MCQEDANGGNKKMSDSDLKKTIRDLKKQLLHAQSAWKATELAKEVAEKAKKGSDVLVKGHIEGTEAGEWMGKCCQAWS